MKTCTKCNTEKALESFYNDKSREDGKFPQCKECHSIYYTKDKRCSSSRNFRGKNPDYQREWNQKNREKRRAYDKKWRKANPLSVNAKNSARLHRSRKRIPKWADMKSIRKFYKNCPEGYHVDHIVPLHGNIVSGLHVLSNLQYLRAEENIKKSNFF